MIAAVSLVVTAKRDIEAHTRALVSAAAHRSGAGSPLCCRAVTGLASDSFRESVPGCRFLPRSTSRFSIQSATGAGSGPWGPPPAPWGSVGVRRVVQAMAATRVDAPAAERPAGHRQPGAMPVDVVGSVACTPVVRGQRGGLVTAVPLLFQERELTPADIVRQAVPTMAFIRVLATQGVGQSRSAG